MVERARDRDWVCVAVVAAAHGLRGVLKLRCFTERAEDVAAYGPVFDRNARRLFELEVIGPAPGGVLARADGIDDRTAAEALRGAELFVPRCALPELGPDEFYYSDLEGMEALRADGSRFGVVRGVDNFGAGDLIEVVADDGRRLSLPFTRRTVPSIDLAQPQAGGRAARRVRGGGDVVSAPAPWTASVLTLFPEMFPGPLGHSLAGRALQEGRWRLEAINLRDFATDRHRTVDDVPFGGGAGMVMRPDVVARAIDAARSSGAARPAVLLTPRGHRLTQRRVEALAAGPGVVILCGRFEGVDQRVVEARDLEELSLGDIVLAGGEPAAIALIDACVRLLPGVIGAPVSLCEESFARDLLEYPHYTRPQVWERRAVPEVLVSGHHARIRAWRAEQAERITRCRRPDLWARHLESAATTHEGARPRSAR